MSAAECNECPTCPVRNAETKPLRSYLDRILFGLFSILLLWAGNRMDSWGQKLEENTVKITALVERMEAMKDWRIQVENRLDRIEQGMKGKRDE